MEQQSDFRERNMESQQEYFGKKSLAQKQAEACGGDFRDRPMETQQEYRMSRPISDFGKLQGILVGVPLVKIEPQHDDKGKRISRLLTWSTGETCLVTG